MDGSKEVMDIIQTIGGYHFGAFGLHGKNYEALRFSLSTLFRGLKHRFPPGFKKYFRINKN
jgi:hypothetical protein